MNDSTVKPALTPKRPPRVVENDEYAAFARRVIRAYGRRIATGDVEALLDLATISAEIDRAFTTAITGLRQQGHSWADIARPLGITRQAAQQRWGGERS